MSKNYKAKFNCVLLMGVIKKYFTKNYIKCVKMLIFSKCKIVQYSNWRRWLAFCTPF